MGVKRETFRRRAGQDDAAVDGLATSLRPRLDAYVELVRRWAPRIDLTSDRDLERFEDRHIRDALRAVPLVRALPGGIAIDVGSGAGLPGIPLALAQPERQWRLLEPRRKRAAFLEEVVRELDLTCEVVCLRAQTAARREAYRAGHVLAIARAVAPLHEAFAMVIPLVASGGVGAVFASATASVPPKAELWRGWLPIMRLE